MKKKIYCYLLGSFLLFSMLGCQTQSNTTQVSSSPTSVNHEVNHSNNNTEITKKPMPTSSILSSVTKQKVTMQKEGLCEQLEEKEDSKEKYNAFNRMIDRAVWEGESLFCIAGNTGVVYFVNQGQDEYLYRIKDGEVKLAVAMPVKEIYFYDKLVYFMIDDYQKYELKEMNNGDIYCYSPEDGTIQLVYPAGEIENSQRHKLKVDENGISFCYSIYQSEQRSTTYYRNLSFGATEPENDKRHMVKAGWEDYYVSYSKGLCLVSRTKGMDDIIEVYSNRSHCCIVEDTIYFIDGPKIQGLNLKTGKKQTYDFTKIQQQTSEQLIGQVSDGIEKGIADIESFVVMEDEIWVTDTSDLYYLNLKTKETAWYKLVNQEGWHYYEMEALYTDGEQLYAVTRQESNAKPRIQRILTNEIKTEVVDGNIRLLLQTENLVD